MSLLSLPTRMSPPRRSSAGRRASVIAVAALLVMAPAAFADATGYEVPSGPNYTVTKDGPGLVKVDYLACLGKTNRLPVDVTTSERRSGTAEPFVLQDEGVGPTFDPTSFQYGPGDTTQQVTVSFKPTRPEEQTFRIKVRSDSGQGQAAGVRVNVTAVECGERDTPAGPPGTPTSPSDSSGSGSSSDQGGVLGVAAEGCVPSARRLRLATRRPTRLTVSAAEGTTVSISGSGVRLRRSVGTTGSVVMTVRPRRGGRIVVTASACFDLQRAGVLAERRASGRRSPRFTG